MDVPSPIMGLAKRLLTPQKSLRGYLTDYAREHTKLGTKITHMIGIPMIVASVPTVFVSPPAAGALFVGGWALQFIGHYVFEKNKPAFFYDPYYLLVGPVWVGLEFAQMVGATLPESLRPSPEGKTDGAPAVEASAAAPS